MKIKKTILKKLITAVFILAVAFLLMPANASAAKKPGKVKNIEEVKATDTSITFKFKKASGAKNYQIQVYEATKKRIKTTGADGKKHYSYKWVTGKKLVKKLETKKTKATIKGLGRKGSDQSYAIKVRACNGNSHGKWETQYMWTTFEGVRHPGDSTATGNNLKKQYEEWKAYRIKDAKKGVVDKTTLMKRIFGSLLVGLPNCSKIIQSDVGDPNQYNMDTIYSIYKSGKGTNVEIYQLVMDICKTAGVNCRIQKWRSAYKDVYTYRLVGWGDTFGIGQGFQASPTGNCYWAWDNWNDEAEGWK